MSENKNEKKIGRFKFDKDNKIGHSQQIIVFKGKYEDSIDVAIKRVLKCDVKLEIELLRKNHIHPNIINYYGTEEDAEF